MKKKWLLGVILIVFLAGCAAKTSSLNKEEAIPETLLIHLELAERYLLDNNPRGALNNFWKLSLRPGDIPAIILT